MVPHFSGLSTSDGHSPARLRTSTQLDSDSPCHLPRSHPLPPAPPLLSSAPPWPRPYGQPCRTSCGSGGPTREHQRLPLATVRAWRGSCGKPAGGHAAVNYVPGIRALTYSLSVLRYPTDTAHRAARQPGTLAQPVAPRGCLCPSLARTHRTLATLPHAVSEAGSRERFVLRRSM